MWHMGCSHHVDHCLPPMCQKLPAMGSLRKGRLPLVMVMCVWSSWPGGAVCSQKPEVVE